MRAVGSHVPKADAYHGAQQRDAHVVQVHVSAPQRWKAPTPLDDTDVAAFAANSIDVFVHAPYLINPATPNPELREKSAGALFEQLTIAARMGAAGVVVHAGSPGASSTVAAALENWGSFVDLLAGFGPSGAKVLVENTASAKPHYPGSTPEALVAVLELLDAAGVDAGWCVDSCHAFAAGWDLDDIAVVCENRAPSLVHLNDSKDPFGSGRDRHDNLGCGHIGEAVLCEVLALTSSAPVVVETPGGPDAQRADISWVRARL